MAEFTLGHLTFDAIGKHIQVGDPNNGIYVRGILVSLSVDAEVTQTAYKNIYSVATYNVEINVDTISVRLDGLTANVPARLL